MSDINLFLEEVQQGEPDDESVAFPLTFTNFARKRLLRRNGNQLFGNWNNSFGAACIDPFNNKYIQVGSIVSIDEVGRCDSGDVVVMVVHY